MSRPWYVVENASEVPSPALLVFPQRVRENIRRMVALRGDASLLRPHVKTSKTPEVVALLMEQSITKFKCATIAEAEMLARCGARDVMLAYQPVGPTVQRLIALQRVYPQCSFSTIVDDAESVRQLSQAAVQAGLTIDLLLDIDNGMHRTGIAPGDEAARLYASIHGATNLKAGGLHVYDGHLHDRDVSARELQFEHDMAPVRAFRERLLAGGLPVPRMVAGGCGTFVFHARTRDVECSAGTAVLWDFGFGDGLPELDFLHAAVLLTRVVSKPGANRICVDLGLKSVASEMPQPRVRFLGMGVPTLTAQSEEHLVFEGPHAGTLAVGDVLYAVPRHVCPTVSLHEELVVVEDGRATTRWRVLARDRRLTV